MIRGLFSAIAFLTRIPVPVALQSRRGNGMFRGYPLAGLLIGAFLSALYAGAHWLFPVPVAVVVLILGTVLLTGGLHLDGLADCADGFYGRKDAETTLRILKDPRIGTMGGVAIGLDLIARFAILTTLPFRELLIGLPLATMLSRTAAVAGLQVLPYVRSEGGILRGTSTRSTGLAALALVVFLAVGVVLPIPVAVAVIALAVFWRVSWKRIRGCTGDVLGASIEIAEIAVLLSMSALVKLSWWGGFFPGLVELIFPR